MKDSRCAVPFSVSRVEMSHDEIRYWLRELYYNAEWGWSVHKSELARALGFSSDTPHSDLKSKLRNSWIYPGEDVRLARRIREILEGQFVLRPTGKMHSGKPLYQATYIDPPEPPRSRATRLQWTIGKQGLKIGLQSPFTAPAPRLPNFKTIFADAKRWNPPGGKE